MTGTSADGIDAALVSFSEGIPQTRETCFLPYPDQLRDRIIAVSRQTDVNLHLLHQLDSDIAVEHGHAVRKLLERASIKPGQVEAIGFHGQTLQHRPDANPAYTLQSGNAARLAAMTGIDVIAHFRQADMAHGGQGAPFAPALHQALLHQRDSVTVVLNLGGIANITVLRDNSPVTGFDTGPANALMDDWIGLHMRQSYDRNGEWAASGRVVERLLSQLSSDEYFKRHWPKSTGRETFNLNWLQAHINNCAPSACAEDVQATLLELTAQTVVDAIRRAAPDCDQVYVCGGGAHNRQLLSRLQAHLGNTITLKHTNEVGVDGDYLEAVLMAWLAWRYLNDLPGNLPSVTGAARTVICGARFPA